MYTRRRKTAICQFPFLFHAVKFKKSSQSAVLEFLNNLYNRNRVVVVARQATYAGGIDSLELIFGLFIPLVEVKNTV
jgi:hypothetical protein